VAGGAMAAVLAAILSAGYFGHEFARHDRIAPRLSIAVLPFRNMGGDPADDYLADAVGDDLTTDLSRLPSSFVIARSTADAYKGRTVDAMEIGRNLGVRYLLEGSLRRTGDSLAINAQLVDTGTGAQLWAQRFDAPRQQLADTQATIVRQIGAALNFTLVQIEGQRSLHERPDNPDALDLFFRARSTLYRDDTAKGLATAQRLLEQANALQPDFVDAMAELAWLLLKKVRYTDDPSAPEDKAEADRLIKQAVAVAPHNARILAGRGFLLRIDGRCQEAIASYQLALSFDANDTDARDGIALCAANLGHPDEAVRQLKDTLLIDPEGPENRLRHNQLGLASLMLGRSEDAIDWFMKAAAGDADPTGMAESLSRQEWNQIGLIAAYGMAGKASEARARYGAYDRHWPHRTVWRLASYFTKAEAGLPGLRMALDGLKSAGMPAYAGETPDMSVPPSAIPKIAGDFEPTPPGIPGGKTISTHELETLLGANPAPLVIDVGCGAAVIPGALWINETFPSEAGSAALSREIERVKGAARDQPVVVTGCGAFGWDSYNAALELIKLGYRDVIWYRGGEEAWAASGLKAEDRRDP
jgi:TolB-like protein/rhodanese-related sulfurtransferase